MFSNDQTQDKHHSVLDAYEWAAIGPDGRGHPPMPSCVGDIDSLGAEDRRRAIAVANNGLPDDDPGKITWELVDALIATVPLAQRAAEADCMDAPYRQACASCQSAVDVFKARLTGIADALSRYLPPREP